MTRIKIVADMREEIVPITMSVFHQLPKGEVVVYGNRRGNYLAHFIRVTRAGNIVLRVPNRKSLTTAGYKQVFLPMTSAWAQYALAVLEREGRE